MRFCSLTPLLLFKNSLSRFPTEFVGSHSSLLSHIYSRLSLAPSSTSLVPVSKYSHCRPPLNADSVALRSLQSAPPLWHSHCSLTQCPCFLGWLYIVLSVLLQFFQGFLWLLTPFHSLITFLLMVLFITFRVSQLRLAYSPCLSVVCNGMPYLQSKEHYLSRNN